MHAEGFCYQCLEKLARRTAELAHSEPTQKENALAEGLKLLQENFSCDKIPATIAGEMQRVIRKVTNNTDPFAPIKEKERELARTLFNEIRPRFGDDLTSLISLAVLGNSIDFFVDLETTRREVHSPVHFARNDIPAFQELLKDKKEILYFADNAGECYFDLPLYEKLSEFARVTYVVKEKPVQNDLTLDDLQCSGLREKFNNVITTGTDTPGLDISIASPEFKRALYSAELLLAKGMGYYETLPEMALNIPIFYLLKAKCQPVANSLNVPLNSYVAFLGKGLEARRDNLKE